MNKQQNGSWEVGSRWYRKIVGEKGHEYHQAVILPKLQRLLQLNNVAEDSTIKVLDLACGNGILGRTLCQQVEYLGIDIAESLIHDARQRDRHPLHSYLCDDVTACGARLPQRSFSHAAIVLSLQNMERPERCLQLAAEALLPGGTLCVVVNHPCFRIPRHSSWQVDTKGHRQFRRVDSYSSSMKVALELHPSRGEESPTLMSHHFSLATLFGWLSAAHFSIEQLEEWHSHKKSEGGAARREDYARSQFPLFLALRAKTNNLCATSLQKKSPRQG